MAIIDYRLEADKLNNKVAGAVKKINDCHCSDFIQYDMDNNEFGVQVSTCSPEYVADVIAEVITKSKYGVVIRKESHCGHFDWQSDTYIKDCAVVEFKLKQEEMIIMIFERIVFWSWLFGMISLLVFAPVPAMMFFSLPAGLGARVAYERIKAQ